MALIEKEAAIEEIGKLIKEYRENGDDDLADAFILVRRYVIKKLPSVDAIPVKWLEAQIKPYTGDVSDIGKSVRNGTIKDLVRKWQNEQEAQDD